MLLVDTTAASDLAEIRPPANEDVPGSTPDTDLLVAAYYGLRDKVIRARDSGNLREALRLCDRALSQATLTADEALIDQAYCNRCGFAIALGDPDVSISRLREIVMRNRSLSLSYIASYVLSNVYSSRKNYKKALFYAKVAHQRAYAIGDVRMMVESHNEIGKSYLSESYLEKAVGECEKALALLPEELSYLHIAPMINLGYAKLLQKEYRHGFTYLYRVLRHCRRHSSESAYIEWVHLYISFGHMELHRWRHAWYHGSRALELAQENGNLDIVKNSLYQLGEIEKAAGDFEAAYKYFQRLQREFYQDNVDLPKLMIYYDTRDLVNLRT